MTTWADVRAALKQAVATSVGWQPAAVSWNTEPQVCDGTFAILSAVSSVPEGERMSSIVDGIETTHEDFRGQVQISFESEFAEKAQDLAERSRTYFAHRSTQLALQALGVSLVQEPGPVRQQPYQEDGSWIDVSLYEIPIRFRKDTVDPNAVLNRALRVQIGGEVGEVDLEIDESNPTGEILTGTHNYLTEDASGFLGIAG